MTDPNGRKPRMAKVAIRYTVEHEFQIPQDADQYQIEELAEEVVRDESLYDADDWEVTHVDE